MTFFLQIHYKHRYSRYIRSLVPINILLRVIKCAELLCYSLTDPAIFRSVNIISVSFCASYSYYSVCFALLNGTTFISFKINRLTYITFFSFSRSSFSSSSTAVSSCKFWENWESRQFFKWYFFSFDFCLELFLLPLLIKFIVLLFLFDCFFNHAVFLCHLIFFRSHFPSSIARINFPTFLSSSSFSRSSYLPFLFRFYSSSYFFLITASSIISVNLAMKGYLFIFHFLCHRHTFYTFSLRFSFFIYFSFTINFNSRCFFFHLSSWLFFCQ